MHYRWFTPEIMVKYPHLGKLEGKIFSNFLNSNIRQISRIAYDISVGKKAIPDANTPEKYIKDWQYLCSYKIDALIDFGTSVCICEIKPTANPSAIGQLIAYDKLLVKEATSFAKFERMIICDHCPTILEPILDDYNIKLHCNDKYYKGLKLC